MGKKKHYISIGSEQQSLKTVSEVYSRKEKNGKDTTRVDCLCKCGKIVSVLASDFIYKRRSTCGCYRQRKKDVPKPINNHDGTYQVILVNSDLCAIIDEIDYDLISKHRWRLDDRGLVKYAFTSYNKKPIRMHKIIPTGFTRIDHKNNNGLDNRRNNLRQCSQLDNIRNTQKRKENTSGYIGVFKAPKGKWYSRIKIGDGKSFYVGLFTCKIEAAIARDEATKKYHGEFAKLNFPETNHEAKP